MGVACPCSSDPCICSRAKPGKSKSRSTTMRSLLEIRAGGSGCFVSQPQQGPEEPSLRVGSPKLSDEHFPQEGSSCATAPGGSQQTWSSQRTAQTPEATPLTLSVSEMKIPISLRPMDMASVISVSVFQSPQSSRAFRGQRIPPERLSQPASRRFVVNPNT